MLDKIYEIFHERMIHKGKGFGIGSGFTSEFLMISFFLIAGILVLRTANSVLFALGSMLILAAILFTVPTVFRVEKENSDSINLTSFYVALTIAVLLIVFYAGSGVMI
jgi:energy-converting hydrogenase B subunit G